MEFSICIDSVYEGRDPLESLAEVHDLGFRHFEFWSWWDKDRAAIRRRKEELGLEVAAFCTRFVSLVDPAAREEYRRGLEESLAVARELGCPRLISQVGDEQPGVERREQHASIVEGLKECAPLLEAAGVTLVFEPLNTRVDHPGYYLWSSAEAFEIAREVESPRVKVIYDLYHQQIMEGNLIPTVSENISSIGHFHSAGHPGRHELDRGEIAYPEVFRAIEAAGYRGPIGVEYFPMREPASWLPVLHEWAKGS